MDRYFEPMEYGRIRTELHNKIKNLKQWIWGNAVTQNNIDKWIENFKGKHDNDKDREQINAMYLLSQFMYFPQKEIRLLLESLYRDLFYKPLIRKIKQDSNNLSFEELKNKIIQNLKYTRFLGLGNSSESSYLLLYYFRQINRLSIDFFMDNCEIFDYDAKGNIIGLKSDDNNNQIKYYIFLDDISGTGQQAVNFFKKINYQRILEFNPDSKICFFTLFRTKNANDYFKNNIPEIITKTVFELDDTYKVFSKESRHYIKNKQYPDIQEKEKEYSKNVCNTYMKSFVESYELCGFLDSQLMLSFFYNTPNNTLPIFWAEKDNKWISLFKRFSKEIKGIN